MVQDFIESESTPPTNSTSSNCHALNHRTQYFILQVLLQALFNFFFFGSWFCVRRLHASYMVFQCCNGFQDILRSEGDAAAESKVSKCVLKHLKNRQGAENTTSLRRWLVTRLKMDGINASLCQTSWATSLGCPAGGSSLTCFGSV